MISELINNWANRTPDKPAIIFGGRPISYSSFERAIAAARGYFASEGLRGPGYAIICDPSLLNYWILSLGLRDLGLTTIALPSPDLVNQFKVLDVRCVVTGAIDAWMALRKPCVELGLKPLQVTLSDAMPLDLEDARSSHSEGGHVLLTSGTTGNQKLVLMTPAMDAIFMRRKAEVIGMDKETVLSAFNFPAWTAAGYRWAASPWVFGGTVIIDQRSELFLPLCHPDITHAVLVPHMLSAVLSAPEGAYRRSDRLQLAVGAGAMSRMQIKLAKERITPHLFNWLASTEAGGIAYTRIDDPENHRWQRLIPDRMVEVVDELNRPLGTGETGRLRIANEGGPCGYLNDALTSQAFFKDGYFYPGDLATIRADGCLALQGRFTDIINVGGNKISPTQIEDNLCEALGVPQVCLFSMQSDAGEEKIYVVIESSAPIDCSQMVPVLKRDLRGVTQVQTYYAYPFPRNLMGKVLRRQLIEQVVARLRSS